MHRLNEDVGGRNSGAQFVRCEGRVWTCMSVLAGRITETTALFTWFVHPAVVPGAKLHPPRKVRIKIQARYVDIKRKWKVVVAFAGGWAGQSGRARLAQGITLLS